MKILFITNIPSPYRVKFFNQLGQICDLTVIFECAESSERDKSWGDFCFDHFTGVLSKGIKVRTDSMFTFSPISYIKKQDFDWLIISNPMSLTGMLEILYLKLKKIPYWIEGDGAFVPAQESIAKQRLKTFLLSGAKGYFSTCKNHDEYYMRYGAPKERIYRYPFTSLQRKDILLSPIELKKKMELREKLGMLEKYIVITVGQFIPRKGFDILLKAAERLGPDVGIYFIGGNALEGADDMEHIHVIPFQVSQVLNQYYDAADLFVFPTREDIWGLVINEAMSRGLPIVTTERCNAGLELVENGRNGYVIPSENENILAEKILDVLQQSGREGMAEQSLAIIQGYTIEEMTERHMQIYEEVVQ